MDMQIIAKYTFYSVKAHMGLVIGDSKWSVLFVLIDDIGIFMAIFIKMFELFTVFNLIVDDVVGRGDFET